MMRFSDFVQWWRAAFANFFFQTTITKPGEGENTQDVVLMSDESGTPTQALTRLEQFGDVVCPPSKRAQCIAVVSGAAGVTMSLCDPGTRPTDGKPGDRGLYSNQAGTRVHLYGASAAEPGKILLTNPSGATQQIKQDGSIRIDAATNQDIVLNSGTESVVRVGDPVFSGDLTCEMAQDMSMPPILTVTLKYRSNDPASPYFFAPKTWAEFKIPGGTAVIPLAGAEETVEIRGRPESGAPHVKA